MLFQLAFVTSLLFHLSAGQFVCCGPYPDYQTYVTLYLGTQDVNNPITKPEAYTGRARRTSLATQGLEMTEYLNWPIEGFENTQAIITDARQMPGRVYTVYKDGSCNYEEFDGLFVTPPCVPRFWAYKETMQLGSAVWDRYGDDNDKNYVLVERSTCQPVMQLATRRNQPKNGIYRFNTEYYYNTTRYTGPINIPRACNSGGGGGGSGGATTRRAPNNIPVTEGTTRRAGGGGGQPGGNPGGNPGGDPNLDATTRPNNGVPGGNTPRVSGPTRRFNEQTTRTY